MNDWLYLNVCACLLPPVNLKSLLTHVPAVLYTPTFSFVLLCSVFGSRTKNIVLQGGCDTIRLWLKLLKKKSKLLCLILRANSLMPIGWTRNNHFLYLTTPYTGKHINYKFYLKSLPSKLPETRRNLIQKITLIHLTATPQLLKKLSLSPAAAR